MNPNKYVTIGVCVRNAEATIKEALESIIEQDYPHNLLELIIVDGCSKDQTVTIIDECLKNVNIKTKIFREKGGLGLARNIVVENATGDYIVWVDGDMTLSKDFIKRQVEFMMQNPKVGIAKGQYELILGANFLSTLEIYSRAVDKITVYSPKKTRYRSLGTSGCIYRVNAIKQVGNFDKSIRGYGEDWDAEFRISTAGWSLCTTQAYYRDYERFGITWKELWCRYWRRGYDLYCFYEKYKGLLQLYRMLPIFAFFSGLLKSRILYKLTRRKFVFLLPFQYKLKMIAWWLGYISHRFTP